MLKFFSNGKELKEYPITQNEYGTTSHLTSQYADGVLQRPLDFGNQKVGYSQTLNDDCKLYSQGVSSGNWICVQPIHYPEYLIMYVHVNAHFSTKVGSICKAGQTICKIAPTSENGGYAIHLHISARKNKKEFFIRQLIFATDIPSPKYKVGNHLIMQSVMNIRDSKGNDIGDAALNSVCEIVEVDSYHNGYQWYKVNFLNKTGVYIADTVYNEITTKSVTNLDGTSITVQNSENEENTTQNNAYIPTQSEGEAVSGDLTNDNSQEVSEEDENSVETPTQQSGSETSNSDDNQVSNKLKISEILKSIFTSLLQIIKTWFNS